MTHLFEQINHQRRRFFGAAAVAVPAPSTKAEVTAEAVMTDIAVADFPKRLSPRICPTISLR